jgi:hypothetical protein
MSKAILKEHPTTHAYGVSLSATDSNTSCGCPHRALAEDETKHDVFIDYTVDALRKHHISSDALEQRKAAAAAFGMTTPSPYPTAKDTQRGNFAEVVLAEYLMAATDAVMPVYRLRYNPNVEQSMKGDDVLLFDLDSDPIRIVVGESKFRGKPSKTVVEEIVEGLKRSSESNLPASLMFVADRLFKENPELGEKVMQCAKLILTDKLPIDYIGFLLSNDNAAANVHRSTKNEVHNMLMVSLAMPDPESAVEEAYGRLEAEL